MLEREQLIAVVQGVQRGDEAAFSDLYEHHKQDIYFHILKTVEDPELAADLTQDAFMEILDKINDLREPAAFVTWARDIAYHRCTAYYRKRREVLVDQDEDGYSVFDTLEEDRGEFIPGEALEKEDLKKAIRDMIVQLPLEQRQALLMRYFDERSVVEIAQLQGVSEGTVKSRLNYARKTIKQAVESYEKRNGIKLRCTGIVPLLLWVFWQYRGTWKLFSGSAATAGSVVVGSIEATSAAAATHAAAAATSGTAGTVASTTACAGGAGATASASAATAVAAKAGGAVATKIVAGVLAATLTVGGTVAVVQNWDTIFPEETQTQEEDEEDDGQKRAEELRKNGIQLKDYITLRTEGVNGEGKLYAEMDLSKLKADCGLVLPDSTEDMWVLLKYWYPDGTVTDYWHYYFTVISNYYTEYQEFSDLRNGDVLSITFEAPPSLYTMVTVDIVDAIIEYEVTGLEEA